MKYFLIFLFLPTTLFAQDISGVWTGYLYNDTTQQKIQYELAVSESNGKPTGYSHTIFIVDSVKNIGVKSVKIKEKKGHFFVEDDKLIYNTYSEPPAKGVKQYSFLTLTENDTAEVLSGIWKTNATRLYRPLTGSVYLEKKKKKAEETLIVTRLVRMGLVDKLSFIPQSVASRLIALNNKPPERKASITETIPDNKNESATPQEEKKAPEKEEQVVVVKEKNKVEPTQIITEENKNINPSVIVEEKPIGKPATQKPKPVVIEEKKIEKPAVITKEQKNAEKQIAHKKKLVITDKKEKKAEKNIAARAKESAPVVKENTSPAAAIDIAKRKIETIRIVEIAQDSLVFSLYDNGAIDGDTVSVLLNGKVIMPRVGLMERATNKTIYLTPDMGDSISVIMYAENLGSIPPNTGLLVIREAEKIYEIRFSGDLTKSSKIIMVRKKEN